jgi:hypothetical protein
MKQALKESKNLLALRCRPADIAAPMATSEGHADRYLVEGSPEDNANGDSDSDDGAIVTRRYQARSR